MWGHPMWSFCTFCTKEEDVVRFGKTRYYSLNTCHHDEPDLVKREGFSGDISICCIYKSPWQFKSTRKERTREVSGLPCVSNAGEALQG